MGGCKAPIPHPQHYPMTTTPPPAPATSTTRRFFFLSIPFLCANNISISSTTSCSSGSKPGIQVGGPLWAIAESVSERERYVPLTKSEKESSLAMSKRISEAVELLEKGRELQAKGDFNNALVYFTMVVENYKDFALSEYARVGRALALYEVGDREEAIAEMEDVSISLKGYPEVHAALAAALYVDKHAPLLAENQFTIATLLDPHYTDLSYVKETKHWPPSLISSLEHFITLS